MVKKIFYISLCWLIVLKIIYDFKLFHTVEVTGSIPVPPTMKIKGLPDSPVALFDICSRLHDRIA